MERYGLARGFGILCKALKKILKLIVERYPRVGTYGAGDISISSHKSSESITNRCLHSGVLEGWYKVASLAFNVKTRYDACKALREGSARSDSQSEAIVKQRVSSSNSEGKRISGRSHS